MDSTQLRKLSLKLFLGFLGATALVAIISVLSGEFGKLQWKILGTCLTISAASICSMSCAAFIEKRRQPYLGVLGILLSIASAALVIGGIWPEIELDEYWKTTATASIAAVAFAHGFLLVLPKLDAGHRWVQRLSSVLIGILALQIIVAVWGEIDNETYYRFLTVVAIMVGLGTLTTPILMKLRKVDDHKGQRLVLEQLEGDIYRDEAGRKYLVKESNSKLEDQRDRSSTDAR